MKYSHKPFLKYLFPFLLLLASFIGKSMPPVLKNGWWKGVLVRADGQQVVFNFRTADSGGKKVLYVVNAEEKLLVDSIQQKGDSIFIQMPFFESFFRAKLNSSNNNLEGIWVKRTAGEDQIMPFKAYYNVKDRFVASKPSKYSISGRWAVQFKRADGRERKAVGEFVQKGKSITGTFLTASGDYRYLQGVVSGDTVKMSAFDGSHAFLFVANITAATMLNGHFYNGATGVETWTATKNAAAAMPDGYDITKLREGESSLNFLFKSIDGKMVSIKDSVYKNKVVIVQLMGSWCPNCMDETRFLSEYYKANRNKGIEIIAIAYENTTDFERAKTSIQRFQKRFDVQYPMLISGVLVSDPLRTEKTLPQLQEIKAFPTTIFIDKKGKVRKIHSGFNGPGTGEHYDAFKKEFDAVIHTLAYEN